MKAVLFDFDYTLGDSTDGIIACLSHGLAGLGFPPAEREAMRRTIGLSLAPALFELTGCDDGDKAREFSRLFKEKADEVMLDASKLLPGAEALLRGLKERGIKTAIVTTKVSFRIRAILQKQGIPELVDAVVGSNDVENEKPHPEAIYKALEALEVCPEDVLYVGDSAVDAECAGRAGVAFAGVLGGTTTRETLSRFENVYIAGDLFELGNFILGGSTPDGAR